MSLVFLKNVINKMFVFLYKMNCSKYLFLGLILGLVLEKND